LGSTISCSTGSMPSGSFVAARIVVHTAATLAGGGVLNNTAVVTASSADIDPNSANNQSTVSTTVLKPRTDLAVTKTGPATAQPDTDITYTITYTNNGPETASNVQMTDTFPTGETFVGFSILNLSPSTTLFRSLGSTISCSTGSMPSGSFV